MTTYTRYKPNFDNVENLGKLSPETHVIEVGYTTANFKKILKLLGDNEKSVLEESGISADEVAAAKNDTRDIKYQNFEKLVELTKPILKKQGILLRDEMPEMGYSPYNLAVLNLDLGISQPDFANILGFSVSKVRQHIASSTTVKQFSGMSSKDWAYVLTVYSEVLKAVDERFGVTRKANKIFFEVGTGRALRLPMVELPNQS